MDALQSQTASSGRTLTGSGDTVQARSLLSVNAYHYRKGGADILYLNHADLMQKHGWKNSFFSMHHAENLPCEDSAYFADEIDYARRGSITGTLINAGRIVYSFEAKGKIGKLLDSRPIDVAHVHNIYHHQSPSVLVELKRRGIPTVLTAHDLKLACPAYTMMNETGICERCKGGRLWNVVQHRCIKGSLAASTLIMLESAIHKTLNLYARNVDKIVLPSEFYRNKLIEWGYSPSQLVHIPNFIPDTDPVIPVIGGDYLLYFGRLSKEKGLATLIRAAARSGVPLRIAGHGPQDTELKQLVQELSAPVTFMGFQSGRALTDLIDGAHAIVLPSEWYENGPMSVIEAFARGKPLIGADIGGIPEMIRDGRTGWSFISGDVQGLASILLQAWNTPQADLADMAHACQELVASTYSEQAYYRAISTLYAELMA